MKNLVELNENQLLNINGGGDNDCCRDGDRGFLYDIAFLIGSIL